MSIIPSNLINSSTFSYEDAFSLTMFWQETTLVVSANVHGLRAEDVKVEIRGRNLSVMMGSGHSICRQLPNNVNVELTTTSINNGVLVVKVPKENVLKHNNSPVVANLSRRRRSFFC